MDLYPGWTGFSDISHRRTQELQTYVNCGTSDTCPFSHALYNSRIVIGVNVDEKRLCVVHLKLSQMFLEICIKFDGEDFDSWILYLAIACQYHGIKSNYLSELSSGYNVLNVLPLSSSHNDSVIIPVLISTQAVNSQRVTIIPSKGMLIEFERSCGFHRHSDISSIGDMDDGWAIWSPVLQYNVVVETFLVGRNGCFQLCNPITVNGMIEPWV